MDKKIDLDGLGFFEELFVDQILKAINVKFFIIFLRLVQSHCQSGAASAAFVEKDTDRLNLFSIKIGGDLLCSRRGHFQHVVLLQ